MSPRVEPPTVSPPTHADASSTAAAVQPDLDDATLPDSGDAFVTTGVLCQHLQYKIGCLSPSLTCPEAVGQLEDRLSQSTSSPPGPVPSPPRVSHRRRFRKPGSPARDRVLANMDEEIDGLNEYSTQLETRLQMVHDPTHHSLANGSSQRFISRHGDGASNDGDNEWIGGSHGAASTGGVDPGGCGGGHGGDDDDFVLTSCDDESLFPNQEWEFFRGSTHALGYLTFSRA